MVMKGIISHGISPQVNPNSFFPDFLDFKGNQAEVETRLAEGVFIHNNTISGLSGFSPRQQAKGESVTIPNTGSSYSRNSNLRHQVLEKDMMRTVIDKSKVNTETLRKAHFTLGDKF